MPHEYTDNYESVRDHDAMLNALRDALLAGEDSIGVLAQTDYDIQNDTTLPADGEITGTVRAPGGDTVQGQAYSSGVWTLKVRWLDEDGAVVREEGISSNTQADTWANFSLDGKSPFVQIVVEDESGVEQTANLTVHYL